MLNSLPPNFYYCSKFLYPLITSLFGFMKLNWICHFNYTFAYDGFGNTTSVDVGTDADSRTLSMYNYGAGNGLLNSLTYSN